MSRLKRASDYPPSIIGKGKTGEEQLRLEREYDAAHPDPSTPLQIDPLRANMRLEALRLAHRPDLSAEHIIERANVLLAWIEQPADKPV